jgi:hypothetical protein
MIGKIFQVVKRNTLKPGYCHPGLCPHAILKTSLVSPSPNFYPVQCRLKNLFTNGLPDWLEKEEIFVEGNRMKIINVKTLSKSPCLYF